MLQTDEATHNTICYLYPEKNVALPHFITSQ